MEKLREAKLGISRETLSVFSLVWKRTRPQNLLVNRERKREGKKERAE